jgi:two-component system response regulator AtoC
MPDSRPAPSVHSGRLLVVDDDRRMASGLAQWLCAVGFHASAAGTADEALQAISRSPCDACIIDGLLPDAGRVAAALRAATPAAGLVVILPSGTDTARNWPGDVHVASPVCDADLLAAIAAARAVAATANAAADRQPVLGSDPSIRHVHDLVARVAETPATVLLTGESGTGKSLVAREIHRASGRAGRFVEVACGALSESLLESELFGHVAGSFTGATADREGKFLQADGGTIFLDEIATASPSMQVKLLRVLQDMQFEAVGGSRTHTVDARVILATHESLERLVAAGSFRADLYWRINVVAIEMPALRNRAGDIPLLAGHFLRAAAAKAGRPVDGFTPAAVDALLHHAWPGNVRELEHAVERGVFLGRDRLIDVADLPPTVTGAGRPAFVAAGRAAAADAAAAPLKQAMAMPERQLILDALERSGWRRDAAAKSLGINRTTLYKKAKRLGMDLAALAPAR